MLMKNIKRSMNNGRVYIITSGDNCCIIVVLVFAEYLDR